MVPRLVAEFGERRVMLAGLWFNAFAFVTYGLAPTGLIFWAAIPIGGIGELSGPPMQGLMTRQVKPTEQGQLHGALGSVRGVAFMIRSDTVQRGVCGLHRSVSWMAFAGCARICSRRCLRLYRSSSRGASRTVRPLALATQPAEAVE